MPVAFLGTKNVKKTKGGFSNCMRLLLRTWFIEPLQLATMGFTIELDRPTILLARFSRIVADCDAIRAAFSLKGASSTLPCCKCRNVLKKGNRAIKSHPYLCSVTCVDSTRYDAMTDEHLFGNYDRLEAQQEHTGVGEFALLQMAAGIVFNRLSLIADRQLRRFISPTSCFILFASRYPTSTLEGHLLYISNLEN